MQMVDKGIESFMGVNQFDHCHRTQKKEEDLGGVTQVGI
jgi:hypothetical protein